MSRLLVAMVFCCPLFVRAQAQVAPKPTAKFQISVFSPQGVALKVDQVRVSFNAPAIRMGDPSAAAPIEGSCLRNGEGRWIDNKNWVYEFSEGLVAAGRCVFRAREKLSSLNGQPLSGDREFVIDTGGGHIQEVYPSWGEIDPEQVFIVRTDRPVKPESVASKAYFTVADLGDRVAVQVLSAAEAKKFEEIYLKANSWQKEEFKKFREKQVLLRSTRVFPEGAEVVLNWPAGIETTDGVNTVEDTSKSFEVKPEFRATASCERSGGKDDPCVPLAPITLSFNTSVNCALLKGTTLKDPKGGAFASDYPEDPDPDQTCTRIEFKGPFPENTELTVSLPSGVKDVDGRPLKNADRFPVKMKTGDSPPLLKFPAAFGLIEDSPNPAIPVTVRMIEPKMKMRSASVVVGATGERPQSFRRIVELLSSARNSPYGDRAIFASEPAFQEMVIDKPNGESAFEVMGIPVQGKGFHAVELESAKLGRALLDEGGGSFYVRSTALVTGMSVHVKQSVQDVFVWVTRLEDSASVSGAEVTVVSCGGEVLVSGKTGPDGTVRLPGALAKNTSSCYRSFYVFAVKGDDLSFSFSDWDDGIEAWRFRVETEIEPLTFTHTIFDRTLLKPGETVSMKHVMRRGSARGFEYPTSKSLPDKMVITHDSGLQKFEFPVTWNKDLGTALATWKIPAEAKLGSWQVDLTGDGIHESTGRIRVENFKIPYLKAHLKTPEEELVQVDRVTAQLGVEYLAGGPAGGLDANLQWSLSLHYFNPEDESLGEFQFLQGDVRGGLRRKGEEDVTVQVSRTPVKLDSGGGVSLEMKGWRKSAQVRRLDVQAEYRDPNGENQTISRSRTLWPTDRLVGVRGVGWARLKDDASFETVVTDLKEKPVVGVPVEMELFSVQYFSHRKRLVGGYYEYEDFEKIESLGRLCQGKTDERGRLRCKGSAANAGRVYAVARIKDSRGVEAVSHASQWLVAKNEELWFGSEEGDRIDLTTVKKQFEPGEVAEFQVQTPFPEATALITVEREGVIHHEVRKIKSSDPRIQLKIDDSWAPNVFVSALLLRGRANGFQPTAMLDLGKPSMKMGLTEIKVGWRKHLLKVAVKVDKPVYEIRSKARARIKVTDAAGRPSRADLAIAVVDEGLLQLLPNRSWDLLPRMMKSRALLVKTSSSQGRVIGKRHFGLKARPAGGDGGRASVRENFDPLLLWVGSLSANDSGEVEVEIPLNDSLSSFRVVAIALNGRDQFGTGDSMFRTTRDLMVFAGAPVFARLGDQLSLEYTLRNSSETVQELVVHLTSTPAREFETRRLSLKPGESALVSWPFRAPEQAGVWSFEIVSRVGSRELDRMKSKIDIKDVWDISTRQATLEQINGKASIYLEPMAGALPGSSKVEVALSQSLLGGQEGLREFWLKYPYSCLEQKVSRIVGLNDTKAWAMLEPTLDSYLDGMNRLRLYQGMSEGQISLNMFVLELTQAAGFKIGDEVRGRLLSAIEAHLRERGEEKSPFLRFDDEDRLAAIALLSRNGRFKNEWLSKLKITPNSWSTGALLDWWSLLEKEPGIPGRDAQLPQVEALLRARMNFTGAKLVLSDETSLDRWWSFRDRDSTTAKLLLAVVPKSGWKDDVPRMMRGFVARQRQGSWELTLANAWGRIALDSYRKKFETKAVTGQTHLALADEKKAHAWTVGRAGAVTFKGAQRKETLAFRHEGTGAPWALTRLVAAVPRTQPISSGFFIEKKIINPKKTYQRGDVVDIEISVKAPADTPWVSIRDPLPPGGIVLGSGLGDQEKSRDDEGSSWRWGPFEERKSHEFVLTFAHLEKGPHSHHYRLRLNQSGEFSLPATRVEAMYDTDIFAEVPNLPWKVTSAP